jgi:hypothetical protein|tara:strand:- start:90 stop:284 length:195 start_codon:yes stop_codon:yes gene_type:complete
VSSLLIEPVNFLLLITETPKSRNKNKEKPLTLPSACGNWPIITLQIRKEDDYAQRRMGSKTSLP